MRKAIGLCVAAMSLFVTIDLTPGRKLNLTIGARAVAGESRTPEIVASQIRRQGYAYGKALSAERDKDHPNERAGWILTCDGPTYHVHLVPNQAADVQKVNLSSR